MFANGSIGKVINYSRAAQRGFVDVGIAYEENLEHAKQATNFFNFVFIVCTYEAKNNHFFILIPHSI